MRPVDLPESSTEKWDQLAEEVKKANGMWVVVAKSPSRARNDKVKEALERRGLKVEVTSRLGNNTPLRPYHGWWTFSRTVK